MSNKNILLRYNFLILLLFLIFLANADGLDVISPELQPDSKVCWAACADMLLQYYGNVPNLHGIWVHGTNGDNIENGLCEYPNFGDLYNVQDILDFGNNVNVSSECHSGTVLWNNLQQDILGAKPIIAGLSDDNHGHVVLVVGFTTSGNVMYNDPWTGTRKTADYDDFCSNNLFYWEETLLPDQGSPVGQVPVAGASISISSGPTEFYYPGSSTTYHSSFSCPSGQTCQPPYQWEWTLSFFSNSGNYTAASGTVNSWSSSTWNVSAFTLPTSGYQWQYNVDGLVMGMVQVTSDGYSAWENVTYAPQTIIPGYVDFNNQTVSGSHSEVYSHHCIGIDNVTINSGASITFNAGSCYNITNLTVQNGSNVTLNIDPSL